METPEIKRKPIKMTHSELKGYYETEFKRACIAVRAAITELKGIEARPIYMPKTLPKRLELQYAINVGGMYVRALERKLKELTNTNATTIRQ